MLKVLKNYTFSLILLCGVAVGAILGVILGEKASVLQPFATVFLNMVFCLIVPLVFAAISNSIASMANIRKLGKVLFIILCVIVTTGLIACVFSFITVYIFDPAMGAHLVLGEAYKPTSADTSIDFVSMITTPNFTDLLSLSHMMALIIFSILFGLAVSLCGKAGEPVANLLNSLTTVLSKFVIIVMYYAPIGIACYFAALIGSMGTQVVTSIIRLSVIYAVFCVAYFCIFHSFTAFVGGGIEGLKRYWRYIWMPCATAAGTCSSSASLPVNLIAAEKMGIPEDIRELTIPLAGLIHKDGVVIVQIMKIVFLFGALGLTFTTGDMFKAVLVALISGMIVGTIPSGGFIGEMFICTAFGLPTAVVPIIVIMGTLTDPFCTTVSVTSQPAICMVISRILEGKAWLQGKTTTEIGEI